MIKKLIMSIPNNITTVHIKRAIEEIEPDKIPLERESIHYFLNENNKILPPKYVISVANKFANGVELDSNSFNAVQAKDFLLKKNFNIMDKRRNSDSNYYPQLEMFLQQAQTDNLKTKHFQSRYKDLEVKVSFGQGNPARIPWISFLKKPNKTSNGIYPVYLYYKKQNILILAYGVSEKNKPQINWNPEKADTIESYFQKKYNQSPKRYGDSFIYKVYDVQSLPSSEIIENDLNEIVQIYEEIDMKESARNPSQKPKLKSELWNSSVLLGYIEKSGLIYSPILLTRFTASLLTKPFVILTGLSGSGKTKLAQAFVQWICEDNNQYCIVPVGADWTNREPLLGYPNALEPNQYILPDNGVLKLLIEAGKEENASKPYFLVLDEMNLSIVERYFADFLSAMESGESIPLHAMTNARCQNDEIDIPGEIQIPKNLYIIGTVNIDETTHMFSPKVLDRANTIEFRITKEEMTSFFQTAGTINMEAIKGKGSGMGESFVDLSGKKDFQDIRTEEITTSLLNFFEELQEAGAEYGYRSASEMLELIYNLKILDSELSDDKKLDIAIIQKLLPKLHGSRRKLIPRLETLGKFCFENPDEFKTDFLEKPNSEIDKEIKIRYPLSLNKIARMYRSAIDNGFASFAEA